MKHSDWGGAWCACCCRSTSVWFGFGANGVNGVNGAAEASNTDGADFLLASARARGTVLYDRRAVGSRARPPQAGRLQGATLDAAGGVFCRPLATPTTPRGEHPWVRVRLRLQEGKGKSRSTSRPRSRGAGLTSQAPIWGLISLVAPARLVADRKTACQQKSPRRGRGLDRANASHPRIDIRVYDRGGCRLGAGRG